jgi:hypothetical protein
MVILKLIIECRAFGDAAAGFAGAAAATPPRRPEAFRYLSDA